MADPIGALPLGAVIGNEGAITFDTPKPVAFNKYLIPTTQSQEAAQPVASQDWRDVARRAALQAMIRQEPRPTLKTTAAPSQAMSVPSALQGQYGGTYFGPDYEAAVASGKFTPQQVAAAEAAKARYAGTPLGLTAQRLGLESEARKADITYAGKEQEALALAAERENTARQAAEVSERAQMERFERMRSDFDNSQAQRMRDMEDLRGEIAATKIDPSQYFAKGNGFGNVLSLLSVALGGFAEGYSGGRLKNNALAMLQNSIAQDIEAQKANLANKRGALSESQSLYGLARQKFGDDQTAMEYTRARQNELLKNQALRFANEGRTDAIRANAQKLAQHFDIESKMSDNRVRQLFADSEAARLRAAAGAEAAAKTAEERALDKELALRTKLAGLRKTEAEAGKLEREASGQVSAEDSEKLLSRYVPSLGAVAGTPKQAEELNDALAQVEKATAILDTMKALRTEGYTGGFGSDAARYDALRTDAIASINRAARLGALDKGTIELLNKSIPESELFSSDEKAAAKLEAARQTLETGKAAAIKNAPLVNVKMEQTARGPVFQYGGKAPAKPVTPTKGWSGG